MSTANPILPTVVPAQVGFFALYNPSLGVTDETVADQIVYYYSQGAQERSRHQNAADSKASREAIREALREEKNEQLRQVGLAQGMVEFGRSFSDGQSVNTVETEKSRIILHEIEAGWWIMASIDLTVLPITTKITPGDKRAGEGGAVEYSSREVKPAILLLGDILRAQSTFLLHHASSLSALFVRMRRPKFAGIIGRYWDSFLSTWSVLMCGNPANSLYGGIKIAACGELGVGVGEEERGSGEREVLEGLVGRIDGLVDVLVSRFGDPASYHDKETKNIQEAHAKPTAPWLGSGNEPAAEDGSVFLGTGALSKKSIRDVSHWMEDLYRWGPYAYGVLDNPTSNRRTKRSARQQQSGKKDLPASNSRNNSPQGDDLIRPRLSPHPPSSASSPEGDGSVRRSEGSRERPTLQRSEESNESIDGELRKGSKLVQFLKLGYGSHWSLGIGAQTEHHSNQKRSPNASINASMDDGKETGSIREASDVAHHPRTDIDCHYLIGLTGNIEEESMNTQNKNTPTPMGSLQDHEQEDEDDRVLLRTLTVELERKEDARAEADISIDLGSSNNDPMSSNLNGSEHTGTSNVSFDSRDRNKTTKLRVVVYVNRPFLFVFLFELRAEILAMAGLYRSLHHQLGPLIKPLLTSTSFRASKPGLSPAEDASAPIYDLIWDSKHLTVTSTIPNIPDPTYIQHASSFCSPWSRVEALNTHMQIVNTYVANMGNTGEMERTSKTSRGWWVVWTRVPDPKADSASDLEQSLAPPGNLADERSETKARGELVQANSRGTSTVGTSMVSGPAHPYLEIVKSSHTPHVQEIFLIRRASDYGSTRTSSRFSSGSSAAGSESWTSGPGKLAQGIGVDTKRYIEALLTLNR